MSEIDKNFRIEREELGVSQLDASVLLGVSRITYIKWEQTPELMPIGKYEQLKREFDRLRLLREEITD